MANTDRAHAPANNKNQHQAQGGKQAQAGGQAHQFAGHEAQGQKQGGHKAGQDKHQQQQQHQQQGAEMSRKGGKH